MARRKCLRTGKPMFPNKLEADLAIADTQRSNSHHRRRKFRDEPTRSYECEFCHSWHLTSQAERTGNRATQSH